MDTASNQQQNGRILKYSIILLLSSSELRLRGGAWEQNSHFIYNLTGVLDTKIRPKGMGKLYEIYIEINSTRKNCNC